MKIIGRYAGQSGSKYGTETVGGFICLEVRAAKVRCINNDLKYCYVSIRGSYCNYDIASADNRWLTFEEANNLVKEIFSSEKINLENKGMSFFDSRLMN